MKCIYMKYNDWQYFLAAVLDLCIAALEFGQILVSYKVAFTSGACL